jgi:multidrug efflux system outer membrane protein
MILRPTALFIALCLAGCVTAPPVSAPKIDVPAAYKEAPATPPDSAWKTALPAEAAARGAWWTLFDDARLNALEDQAAAASPTLALAAARVKAARSSLRGAEADRWPQLGLNLGAARTNTPPPTTSTLQATLGARYEADLFKRVEHGVSAARADAHATEASYRSVLLALQADVAQTYFALRTLDAEIAQVESTVRLREENTRLIAKRFQAGAVAELDVARSSTELSTVQAELAALRGRRARAEHALALLLGQAPAAFSQEALPLSPTATLPQVPAGLPSALLERRPDVSAAQHAMQAAAARVGVARSALFPALALTASGGFASSQLEDVFKWSSRAWLASAVLSLPVVDGGRNRAAVAGAEAQLEGAAADYRDKVLAAFADVEDSLSDLRAVHAQLGHTDASLTSARRAAALADKRYRAGEDSYLQLLDAQRDLLAIERQAVTLRGTWAAGTVALVRALGGGWQVP